MERDEVMKNTLQQILMVTILSYLTVAFIVSDINSINWSSYERLGAVILMVINLLFIQLFKLMKYVCDEK